MLQTEHKEIEKEKTKNKFELFFPKDFYEGLKALLERKKTLKFSVLVDGKNIGEMSFSLPTKTKDVNEIKGMIESGLQELLAQKNIEGAVHLIRLVFIPEEGEKQEVPQEAPIALDIYAESLNRKKEFDEQKDKIEGRGVLVPIVKEEKEGYVVIFPYPQQFPLEQISREYIERASEPEIKKIGEILNSIKESERKNVTVYITIEDYTKLKENETIKEKILTNYQSKFKSLEVKFKVLTTQDIAQLIEEGAIKENQIDNLKNALINAKNKDNQSVWTDKQKQQILESNQEELKEFLKNNYAELYFEKNVRDKYPILEQIYNNYRKINVEQGPLNIEFDKNNLEILNPNRVELVLYVKVLYGNEEEKKYSNNTQKFKPLAYLDKKALDKEQEILIEMKKKEKDRPLEDRLLYKIIFIPKKEELQKFKGIVFFDFSYHVEEFMGPIGEKIKEDVEQNPEGRFIELKKNEPKNYNLAIKELNETFEKYFGKEELSQKEQKIIETIKRDGITIIGDLAITDPNKVFEPEEFKNFLKNCSRLKEDGIKIRFLVIAPEKFTYNYKGQKRENTIEQRIEEFYNIEGMEKKKEERREGLEYYRLAYENNSIEIVYINSDEKKLEDLEKALKYFIK